MIFSLLCSYEETIVQSLMFFLMGYAEFSLLAIWLGGRLDTQPQSLQRNDVQTLDLSAVSINGKFNLFTIHNTILYRRYIFNCHYLEHKHVLNKILRVD